MLSTSSTTLNIIELGDATHFGIRYQIDPANGTGLADRSWMWDCGSATGDCLAKPSSIDHGKKSKPIATTMQLSRRWGFWTTWLKDTAVWILLEAFARDLYNVILDWWPFLLNHRYHHVFIERIFQDSCVSRLYPHFQPSLTIPFPSM